VLEVEIKMALRSNHYDNAFQEFLRDQQKPHVVVDERRRALMANDSLKSMDFIVYSSNQRNLLVDVKGRRFPSGGDSSRHKWENWATEDDLRSLMEWEQVFGSDFRALLVFAYDVDQRYESEFDSLYTYRDREYSFFGVWADDYRATMRRRSAAWETVSLPGRAYRRLRAPIAEFL
jgi:hypothetical protein